MRIGNDIPRLPTLGFSHHDAAVPQARQMIRHVRSGQPELAGQLSGIGRPLQQSHKKPGTGRVRHRPTQPIHHVQTRSDGQHVLNNTASAEPLTMGAPSTSTASLARHHSAGGKNISAMPLRRFDHPTAPVFDLSRPWIRHGQALGTRTGRPAGVAISGAAIQRDESSPPMSLPASAFPARRSSPLTSQTSRAACSARVNRTGFRSYAFPWPASAGWADSWAA